MAICGAEIQKRKDQKFQEQVQEELSKLDRAVDAYRAINVHFQKMSKEDIYKALNDLAQWVHAMVDIPAVQKQKRLDIAQHPLLAYFVNELPNQRGNKHQLPANLPLTPRIVLESIINTPVTGKGVPAPESVFERLWTKYQSAGMPNITRDIQKYR